MVDSFHIGPLTVEIHYDECPQSPRDWDNIGRIVGWHRRYKIGDGEPACEPHEFFRFLARELDVDVPDVDDDTDDTVAEERARAAVERIAVVLPVYMLDHSGIAFSVGGFGDRWDSGQVGWTYATHAKIAEEFGLAADDVKAIKGCGIATLKAELETYGQYANGAVFGYVVRGEGGGELDSCWGFYGDDARDEGRASAESILAGRAAEAEKAAELRGMITGETRID